MTGSDNCNDYRDTTGHFRCKLGKAHRKKCKCVPKENSVEKKYKTHNYNGLFTKPLAHNPVTGELLSNLSYEHMRDYIVANEQVLLDSVPLAPGSVQKLVNPLAANASVLVGAYQCALKIDVPPALNEDSAAAEMVELYCQAYCRDVPFTEYDKSPITNQELKDVLGLTTPNTFMNNPAVLSNLPYNYAGPATGKTLFRGIGKDEVYGPYVSQLALLDIPFNLDKNPQSHIHPTSRSVAIANSKRVDWGVTVTEKILQENGNITSVPGSLSVETVRKYIHTGRDLAEYVHNDPPYLISLDAAIILGALGASVNPGFPVYSNQNSFITSGAAPNLQCAIGQVCCLALQHAWYWKWIVHRKLRPDAFGLWTHNAKAGVIANAGNYDISNVLLNNEILPVIKDINNSYVPGSNSYTLSSTYKEGCPPHPSYPAGHSTIAGACLTMIKMFYNTNKLWSSLPGVISGSLASGKTGPVEADPDTNFTTLRQYTGSDNSQMTINGELNKLASNIGIGRDWAGIHYRSDGVEGLSLGEQVAIHYMEDLLSASVEKNLDGSEVNITFIKFDGTPYTVKPKI